MVALRNKMSPGTLMQWVFRGLDESAPKAYRDFAEAFVTTEAEISGQLVQIVMDSAMGRRRKPTAESEFEAPSVDDAKWMLVMRFQFLWRQQKDGSMGGKSCAEVVSERIVQLETSRRDQVRRILAQLPEAAKKAARQEGYMVP